MLSLGKKKKVKKLKLSIKKNYELMKKKNLDVWVEERYERPSQFLFLFCFILSLDFFLK
jgi:hypothetical protein